MKRLDEEQISLLHECYKRSLHLLKENSKEHGIIACAPSAKAVDRHYASIFGRDAALCSMGMVVSGSRDLIRLARKSLITLGKYQAPNGQIPKYVKPEIDEVDFWYYGCIDATLWWLIAINFFDRHVPGVHLARQLDTKIKLALYWLLCQEHQGLYLLQQNEASDWADIMPRSGFVLYSNALWYHVKRLYDVEGPRRTRHFFRQIFYPFGRNRPEHRRARILTHYIRKKEKESDFFLSFVNFSFWGPEIDVFGNILSGLMGLCSLSSAGRMVDSLLRMKVNVPDPIRVVHRPIRQNSMLWRSYMERHKQNFPYQYHNGGIWPFVSGFWIMLLSRLRRKELAWQEMVRFARANNINNWGFPEWLHGKTGEPMGMDGQSWNAAMFILAWQILSGKARLQHIRSSK